MAFRGDPTKRPPPLQPQQESAVGDNETGRRRHHRSLTLESPRFGNMSWGLSDHLREHSQKKRMSVDVNTLLRGTPPSAQTVVPELPGNSIRHARSAVPVTQPSVRGMIELRNDLRAGRPPPSGMYCAISLCTLDEKVSRSLSNSTKHLLSGLRNTVNKIKKEKIPIMPIKAAETLGVTPREYRKQHIIPLKPSKFVESPAKDSPAKGDDASIAPLLRKGGRGYDKSEGRQVACSRASSVSRVSKGTGRAIHINADATKIGSASPAAPTPPAKDTPPRSDQFNYSASPLRHKFQAPDLRGTFELSSQSAIKPPFKVPRHLPIAKSLRELDAEKEDASYDGVPVKMGAYNANDMTALIEGPPANWPLADDSNREMTEEKKRLIETTKKYMKMERETREAHSKLLELDQKTKEKNRKSRRQSERLDGDDSDVLLPPRFYSPANHSAGPFAVGESPSKNSAAPPFFPSSSPAALSSLVPSIKAIANNLLSQTDPNRMLFSHCPETHATNLSDASSDSKNGSIGVMFQGSADDIDRGSSTYKMLTERDQAPATTTTAARDDKTITSRVMQELRIGEHDHSDTASNRAVYGQSDTASTHVVGDQSDSARAGAMCDHSDTSSTRTVGDQPAPRLTAMLNEAILPSLAWTKNFQPKCPSAVPSPLHHTPGPVTPGQSAKDAPGHFGRSVNPMAIRNIDDHFWMTNEHLDVVGKTTWDILAMASQETMNTLRNKHARIMTLCEEQFEELKSHLTTVDDKADRSAEKVANVHHDVDRLLSRFNSAFAAQDNKTTQMEQQLRDLQTSMQNMQTLLEQKINEAKSSQQALASDQHTTPNSAQSSYLQQIYPSQSSLGGFYGSHANGTRDGQSQMSTANDVMAAASTQDSGNAAQTGYDAGYGQQWVTRTGYPVRGSSREARTPYSGTNPYQYAATGTFNGGYPVGYTQSSTSSPTEPASGLGPGQAR
ncbi:hypothetical protein IAQ61_007153 [Plenodomus lingam]|uniref:uncharacterized protein n=1 Tax=Leptosphaeria maculans TaxID=5022 RepID=UPI0033349D42|nr:hypothetical protein IAQ61_007153 [Plenodomus lingam]